MRCSTGLNEALIRPGCDDYLDASELQRVFQDGIWRGIRDQSRNLLRIADVKQCTAPQFGKSARTVICRADPIIARDT